MKRISCCDCGKNMGDMEIALNLKLLGRHIGNFHCDQCLAKVLDCSQAKLIRLARHYQESGCILFQRNYVG